MKKKTKYKCTSCGHIAPAWVGKCPVCGEWGTIEEVEEFKSSNARKSYKMSEAIKLMDVNIDTSKKHNSRINEFNRVIGNGLVKDSVSILTAKPGSGKSTLLLELAYDFADQGLKVLYISGEESESQIKSRANRIMNAIPDNIWLLSTNSMDSAINSISKIDPDIVFVDSIQTFTLEEFSSKQGSPVQTVECTGRLIDIAKDKGRPRAVILVGHMTKADEMAGLRTLEHMVDTVMILESEFSDDLRILYASKNRFGRTGEIGLFKMMDNGIKEVENPSEEFITIRDNEVAGSAIGITKEGSRYMAVEIESLVSNAFQAYPLRIGDSLNKDRLNTIIAILEQRAGLRLYDKNVIIKTTGGLNLKKQDSDLAVLMSIASSVIGVPIDNKTAFVAEVGLTGELKAVQQLENRIMELKRLGYKRAFCSKNSEIKNIDTDFTLVRKSHISEVIDEVLKNK